jgi:phage shock protein C
MDKIMLVTLLGQTEAYRLEPAAYDHLERYLASASLRLREDPDRAEIVGDLERSVGEKLAMLPGSADRLVTVADVDSVLEAIGGVDGNDATRSSETPARRPRRLQRIRQGQQLAGVCTGLAAYSQIRVDWVRMLFLVATTLTVGGFALVYVALAFILPVAEVPET